MTEPLQFLKIVTALTEIETRLLGPDLAAQAQPSRGLSVRPLMRLERGDICSEVPLRVARNLGCSVESVGPQIVEAVQAHTIGSVVEPRFEWGYLNMTCRASGDGILPSVDLSGLPQLVTPLLPESIFIVPPKNRPAALRLGARALVQRACAATFGSGGSIFLGTERIAEPSVRGLWQALGTPHQVVWEELCELLAGIGSRRAAVWLWPQEYPERAFREMVARFPNVIFRAPAQRWFEELREEDLGELESISEEAAQRALLASSLEGAGLDLRVARCGEGWNLPWFYRSLEARAATIAQGLGILNGRAAEFDRENRGLWHRFALLPLFRGWAAVQGDVGEYLDALMEAACLSNLFLNNPGRRIAWARGDKNVVDAQILAGVTSSLRDTIGAEPVL